MFDGEIERGTVSASLAAGNDFRNTTHRHCLHERWGRRRSRNCGADARLASHPACVIRSAHGRTQRDGSHGSASARRHPDGTGLGGQIRRRGGHSSREPGSPPALVLTLGITSNAENPNDFRQTPGILTT
jgi:hypothetical protein